MLNKKPIFEIAEWRLIVHEPGNGAWNMAVDEALFDSVLAGESIPALRLYAWTPPCLSLGYGQSETDADLDRLRVRGWDLVRRPTGGKAILHTDELTYSVIGSNQDPRLAGGILESYLTISGALASAMVRLGLDVDIQPAAKPTNLLDGPVCFEVPSPYEITAGDKKLIGSAQSRRGDAILQHGTIPLHGDITRITQVLSYSDEDARMAAAARLRGRATTIEEELVGAITWEAAATSVQAAFEANLNLNFLPSVLTDREIQRARHLMAGKYQLLEDSRQPRSGVGSG